LDRIAELGNRHQVAVVEDHAWRSVAAMGHARRALAAKRQLSKDAKTAAHDLEQATKLARIAESFPQVARACGIRPSRGEVDAVAGGKRGMSDTKALSLLRASFEAAVPRGLGVKHERLLCFAAELVTTLQQEGLMFFFEKMCLVSEVGRQDLVEHGFPCIQPRV
jgi:hypothetical protein